MSRAPDRVLPPQHWGSQREAESLAEGSAGAPQAPTDLTVIRLPGQEASADTRVPDTDLTGIGAAVQQGRGPITQGRQLACPHRLRDGLSVQLRDTRAVWVSNVPGPSLIPSSKTASEPWHLEADVGPTLLQETQGEGALAHTGELTSIPGVEGHAMHWLWEVRGGKELIGGHAPQGQGSVTIVPWGEAGWSHQRPKSPRTGREVQRPLPSAPSQLT